MFSPFEYVKAENLEEVFELLDKNDDAQIIAGGTDLLVKLREAKSSPETLIDIKGLEELKGIKKEGNKVKIGALTTITELKNSELIKNELFSLYQAASEFGCYEIRNRATIGGNIVHASPGAEFGVTVFALDAKVEVVGQDGIKEYPIDEFWYDVGKVKLKNELLKSIIIDIEENTKSSYHRLSRVDGMDLAVVNTALAKKSDGSYKSYFGTVARTPYRNEEIDQLLNDNNYTNETFKEIQKIVDENVSPRASSLRASPEYKKKMVVSLLKRCLRDIGELGDDIDG
ncbi:MAG: xanthine dehydrogenase family protein subunit M [Halanaerobiales bacterium]|nr:xanthine dehydrogenase family protein subunit M [Halanaerobiales bacterium]